MQKLSQRSGISTLQTPMRQHGSCFFSQKARCGCWKVLKTFYDDCSHKMFVVAFSTTTVMQRYQCLLRFVCGSVISDRNVLYGFFPPKRLLQFRGIQVSWSNVKPTVNCCYQSKIISNSGGPLKKSLPLSKVLCVIKLYVKSQFNWTFCYKFFTTIVAKRNMPLP